MLRTAWCRFRHAPPLAKAMTTYAIMWPTGCLLQQTIEGRNLKTYDWVRCMKYSLFGGCFIGPNVYGWVRLGSIMWPQTNFRIGVFKAFLDVISFSPYMAVNFFFFMSLLEGKTTKEAVDEVKQKFWPTIKMHFKVWPILNTINFSLVPESHRVLFTSFFGVLWTAYLAFMKTNKSQENEQQQNSLQKSLQ